MNPSSKKWLAIIGTFLLVGVVAAAIILPRLEPKLREKMVHVIEDRFDGTAEIQSLQISLFPRIQVNGKKLVLWYKNRRDIPPLISIDEFTADGAWTLRVPAHVQHLVLKGLVIQIPPKSKVEETPSANVQTQKTVSRKHPVPFHPPKEKVPPFIIDSVVADGTVLKILPKDPKKDPMVFELYRLNLHSVDLNSPMKYDSTLKNATPPGLIDAKGEFGPWNRENPGRTPVTGNYVFQKADLSVFKGISGILSSVGQFKGVLEHITADGTTDTPDFKVKTGNQPVRLQTEFHAVIDGTNGDTLLQPVKATFGNTVVICRGGIVKKENQHGKTVMLNVKMEKGRMEDIMKFVIPTRSPVVGNVRFTAKFELPPGDVDMIQKLKMDGTFDVQHAEFTSSTVQEKIDTLSQRSRGIHEDSADERIVSDLHGVFNIGSATVKFETLSFAVPGATVQLKGQYGMESEKIDFQGTLQMQAKLSETQTGIKSILLKVVDPFFKKGTSGAVIPIKISGTVKDPSFGLNLGGK